MENTREQNIFLSGRKVLEITGVCDVSALSEDEVEMSLSDGALSVEGKELKIDSFSSETGKIRIVGEVDSITYFERPLLRRGLFRKKG